jgi:hypothetical protein
MLLGVMLALALAAAVPAVAQVGQELGQDTSSGDVAVEFSVSGEGDYSSVCAAPLQFGNTANLQNAQGFLQYSVDDASDLEGEGSSFVFEPAIETTCDQAVQQSSAASSTGY